MKNIRGLSLVLALIMLMTSFSISTIAQSQQEKESRLIYLHAFKESPLLTTTSDRTTVYMGDTVNVSLAVDKPNKAENPDTEPQFNLGGFTVKIYFDTRYFKFDDSGNKTPGIEYYFVADNGWADDDIENGTGDIVGGGSQNTNSDAAFDKPGFVKYSHGTHTKDGVTGTYGYAYATIFYSGKSLPYTANDAAYWYDIARLPLIPRQTGNTQVQVDISGDDEYTLELFAKDHPDLSEIKRSFDFDALNSGVFNITIADKSKPNPPLATPGGSTYTSVQNVKLSVENPDDLPAEIYYTLDGSEPNENSEKYDFQTDSAGGILIDKSTTLKCITIREKDGRVSNTATYLYNIVPGAPVLFNENKELISNSYTENWAYTENWDEDGYKVYASDKAVFSEQVTDGSTIYYTFSTLSPDVITDSPSNSFVGNNPETQWVKVSNDTKELNTPITKLRTVRLVNEYRGQKSSVSTYFLGVKPGAVSASPSSDSASEAPVIVNLGCYAPPGASIYYTTNGYNPKTYGTLYDTTITLTSDTTIKAVSFYEGVWGDICTFHYEFTNNPDENIIAYNPPGNYEGSVSVSLIPKEPGKKIIYSIDNAPFGDYTNTLALDKDCTITAYIVGNEQNKQTFTYKIKPIAPVFSPESTQLTQAEWITIFTPGCTALVKDNFELKFTVDGTIPTKNTVNPTGTKYTYNPETHEARIYVTEATTINAIVVKYGQCVSNVSSHKYEIINSRPSAPSLILPDGDYTTSKNSNFTTIFKYANDVDIYYTYATDGNPVPDPDPNNESHKYSEGNPVILKSGTETVIKAIAVKKNADGNIILSDMMVSRYRITNEEASTPPGNIYSDKPSGTYTEGNTSHTVTLYGSNDIWYSKNGEEWQRYTEPVEFDYSSDTAILYAKDGESGDPVLYVYHFEPPAPVITPISGVYRDQVEVCFDFPEGNYRYYIQQSGGERETVVYRDISQKYTQSISVEAYVVNTLTGAVSKHVYGDYIVTQGDNMGELTINWPYNSNRISKHLLGTDEYAKGITFGGTYGNNRVLYQVKYTPNGDIETEYSPIYTYDDKLPVIPTKQMEDITIKAWIEGKMDNYIEHKIVFEDLGVPSVTTDKLKNTSGNYPINTNATVHNENSSISNIVVFYTTNGSLPTNSNSARTVFSDGSSEAILLTNTTTIKAVYFSACGSNNCVYCSKNMPQLCKNGIYGEVFSGIYPIVQTPHGGSGGGGSTTVTRKYTKDIFGNEHPTHIGYINGYPDGSVSPEGSITREEIASVLYRITNHDYEKPFVKTGSVFPDVEIDRWSAHDIEYMAEKNVIVGYPDGSFLPSGKLTRAEFATLILRFTKDKYADSKNPFSDLDSSHWAYSEIISLVNKGLMEGYEDGTFRPQNIITRAEAMTVINKILGRKPMESYIKSLTFNPYNDLLIDKWYYVTVLEATITHNYYLDSKGIEYKWEDWK